MTTPDGDEIDVMGLSGWLTLGGYAAVERGYGHVSGDDLAEALLERFSIVPRDNDGKDNHA